MLTDIQLNQVLNAIQLVFTAYLTYKLRAQQQCLDELGDRKNEVEKEGRQ